MLTAIGRDFKIRGYTVGQSPNPPLWIALAALLVGYLTSGALNDLASAVFFMAFTVWAYEEAVRGVNGFRRLLGVIALVLIAVAIARAIG